MTAMVSGMRVRDRRRMASVLMGRFLLAPQLQLHRLIDSVTVRTRPSWHFNDDGKVLRRFVAISLGLLFPRCSRHDQINRGEDDGVSFCNRLRLLQFRGMRQVCQYDV